MFLLLMLCTSSQVQVRPGYRGELASIEYFYVVVDLLLSTSTTYRQYKHSSPSPPSNCRPSVRPSSSLFSSSPPYFFPLLSSLLFFSFSSLFVITFVFPALFTSTTPHLQ